MGQQKLSRNAPCPCRSGKKYKQSCWNKGFEWQEDDSGRVFKSMPLHPEAFAIIDAQRQKFVAEHGRDPGPDDLLFPDLPHGEHLEAKMVEDMKKAGLDPALIYAFEKTPASQLKHRLASG